MNEYTEQSVPVASGTNTALLPVGAFLKEVWMLLKARFLKLAVIALIPAIALYLMSSLPEDEVMLSLFETTPAILLILPVLLFIAIWVLMAGVAALFVAASAPENTVTIRHSLGIGFKKLLSLIWIGLLMGFIIMTGVLLFVVPGIFLSIAFIFAVLFLVNEDARGLTALTKSYNLVAGRWWAVFLRYMLVYVLLVVISGAITFAFRFNEALGESIAFLISMPLTVSALAVLYKDLKRGETPATPEVTARRRKVFIALAILYPVLLIAFVAVFVSFILPNLPATL